MPPQGGQWGRLLWSPFLHADGLHLYYNTASLLVKGLTLEPALGPARFAALVAELAASSQALYLAAAWALAGGRAPLGLGAGLWGSCAVGFSGVLFGLKAVINHDAPGQHSRLTRK